MSSFRRHARGLSLSLAWALTIGVSVLLLPAPGSADPARARAHFDLGKRYFEVDEYRRAIEEFKAAHIEEPDPAFLYNIAECHRHLGENRDAMVFYRRFLALSPANAPQRATVEKRLAELQAKVREEPAAATTSGAPAATAATPAPAPAAAPASAPARPAAALPVLSATAPPGAAPAAPVMVNAPVVQPAVTLSEESTTTAPAEPSPPFYKRTWFYVVVGGALVAGTIGVWAAGSGKNNDIPGTPLGNQPAFR